MTKRITVLVGPPCSGKSSYLKDFESGFVISSDRIVEILCRQHMLEYHEYFLLPKMHKIRIAHDKIFYKLVQHSKRYAAPPPHVPPSARVICPAAVTSCPGAPVPPSHLDAVLRRFRPRSGPPLMGASLTGSVCPCAACPQTRDARFAVTPSCSRSAPASARGSRHRTSLYVT